MFVGVKVAVDADDESSMEPFKSCMQAPISVFTELLIGHVLIDHVPIGHVQKAGEKSCKGQTRELY